jgi:hypothetical protein
MAFIDIFNFKKYFAKPSDSQVARYGHVNALYDTIAPFISSPVTVTQETSLITAVTANARCGKIELAGDFNIIDGLDTIFTFNNSEITTNSVILTQISGSLGNAMFTYVAITDITNGSCEIACGIDPNGNGIQNPVLHFLIIN